MPTAVPCVSPLKVKNIDYIEFFDPRASVVNGWLLRGLSWDNETDFGYVPDNLNFWFDGGLSAVETQLKLRIEEEVEPIGILEGDMVRIGYDTYYYLDVILPEVSVNGTALYVGVNGSPV